MKLHHLCLLLLFCSSIAMADFSSSKFIMHPADPLTDPFVLEIAGEWPTDCHPGEQKPVITDYTGATVLIEFETIVEHVGCNDFATPFRVLVDMSDVITESQPSQPNIEATIRFDGTEFTTILHNVCICSPAPRGPEINPEPGLYGSQDLEKQGLLVARQNDRMAVYPLIYDDSGSSEWLFGAGGIDEDVFFSDLYELTGGQCLGCPPPDDAPQMNVVGKITMLMDSGGLTQVKVNDGMFVPYEESQFGYGSFNTGGNPERHIADFSGRWAFVDDSFSRPVETPDGYRLLPEIFDVRLVSVEPNLLVGDGEPPPTIGTPPPFPPGYVLFSIWDIAGNKTAQMQCSYNFEVEHFSQIEMTCEVSNADIEGGETQYQVRAPSLERLNFTWLGVVIESELELPVYTAVRVDELK